MCPHCKFVWFACHTCNRLSRNRESQGPHPRSKGTWGSAIRTQKAQKSEVICGGALQEGGERMAGGTGGRLSGPGVGPQSLCRGFARLISTIRVGQLSNAFQY